MKVNYTGSGQNESVFLDNSFATIRLADAGSYLN